MLKAAVETSIIFGICKIFYNGYCSLRGLFRNSVKNSYCRQLLFSTQHKIVTAFRYSIFGRATDMGRPSNAQNILAGSRFLRKAGGYYQNCSLWLGQKLKGSSLMKLAGNIKERLYSFPLRETGIIILVAIVTNVILSFIFKRQINAWGWFMRGLLASIALADLSCSLDWPGIKESSRLLRWKR